MAHRGYVLPPGEGRRLDMGPFGMVMKASAADSDGGLALLEAVEPAGFGPPLHIHDDSAEVFYVLEGEYIVHIEGAEHRCPSGSFVYVPVGIEHGFRVGSVESRKLNIYVPSAMEGYFRALATATEKGVAPSDSDLTELAARHAMRVTGPVPGGYQ